MERESGGGEGSVEEDKEVERSKEWREGWRCDEIEGGGLLIKKNTWKSGKEEREKWRGGRRVDEWNKEREKEGWKCGKRETRKDKEIRIPRWRGSRGRERKVKISEVDYEVEGWKMK